jgi:hypothetical protein
MRDDKEETAQAPPTTENIAIIASGEGESPAVDRESGTDSSEPSRHQWMKLSEAPLAFWNAPGEDIYTEADGEPV